MSESATEKRARLAIAIEAEQARLDRLEVECAAAKAHVVTLRARMAALDVLPQVPTAQDGTAGLAAPQSPREKVKLFRSLFRGREDLYPTRFISKKTGKPGYHIFRDGRITLLPQPDGYYVARSEILPLVLLTQPPSVADQGGRGTGAPRLAAHRYTASSCAGRI